MPIIYRDSETWFDDLTGDAEDVLGDADDELGESDDSAALFLKMMFGDPIQQMINAKSFIVTVKRSDAL